MGIRLFAVIKRVDRSPHRVMNVVLSKEGARKLYGFRMAEKNINVKKLMRVNSFIYFVIKIYFYINYFSRTCKNRFIQKRTGT